MGIINLISAANSSELTFNDKKITAGFDLKLHESITLKMLIAEMKSGGADESCFNGYFVGYSIKQISKEFDLLRFGKKSVINIELKSCLQTSTRDIKIKRQMSKNQYYLEFLKYDIDIYTFIQGDGLYYWDNGTEQPVKVKVSHLLEKLQKQKIDFNINPDNLFLPKNYLISTFNDTDKFLAGNYFLTDHQDNIKKEVFDCFEKNMYRIFCISANAGTGKTLLAYDIAKEFIKMNVSPLIIHSGKLNEGHNILRNNNWNIISIRSVTSNVVNCWKRENIDIIVIDESHRTNKNQLNLIIDKSYEEQIPLIFLYDTKQFLRTGETTDVHAYIAQYNSNIPLEKRKLSNKIRTNKEMASFINNLMHIGSSKSNLNYESVSIEYFHEFGDIKNYVDYLVENHGWKAITFSNSLHYVDPLDTIAELCETNAHGVIGQEFEKVVFVMDGNFRYSDDNTLQTRQTYYSATGMLYQIVTRVVLELKIVVLNNPSLFNKLLSIKKCSFIEND